MGHLRNLAAAAAALALLLTAAPATASQWGANYATPAHPDEALWETRADVARVFEPDRLGTWDDYPALTRAYADGVRRFWVSWKGSAGADVRAFGASIPDDATVWGTYWHEPEEDIANGTLTLTGWKRTTRRLAAVQREVGMVPATILMFYTLEGGAGRDVDDYRLRPGSVDVWGFDAHMWGDRTPRGVAKALLREKRLSGLPLGLGETSGTAKELANLKARLAGKVRWGCFFAKRSDPVTQAEVDAWMGNP